MHRTSVPYQQIEQTATTPEAIHGGSTLRAYWELTKPRLSFLSVFTALAGYLLAKPVPSPVVFAAVFFGTSFAAAAAAALNQWMEWRTDSLMERTRRRPLPSGQLSKRSAFIFGNTLAILGILIMWFGANPLAASLVLITLLSYLFIYTPLKRVSSWNTIIGAFPGALPPLTGWAAATNSLGPLGWILFGILFCWQIPHFMAIAWMFREDYAKGKLKMSTVLDPTGRSAGRQAVLYAVALLVLSLLPCLLHYSSWFFYGVVAVIAGVWMLRRSIGFWRSIDKNRTARRLFLASICYLPFILIVIVLDRMLLG